MADSMVSMLVAICLALGSVQSQVDDLQFDLTDSHNDPDELPGVKTIDIPRIGAIDDNSASVDYTMAMERLSSRVEALEKLLRHGGGIFHAFKERMDALESKDEQLASDLKKCSCRQQETGNQGNEELNKETQPVISEKVGTVPSTEKVSGNKSETAPATTEREVQSVTQGKKSKEKPKIVIDIKPFMTPVVKSELKPDSNSEANRISDLEPKKTKKQGEKPKSKQEEQPVIKPETKPVSKPESKPASKPEGNPSSNPEEKPKSKPEKEPSKKPKEDPSNKPEGNHRSKPETDLGSKPEVEPRGNSSRKPAVEPKPKPEKPGPMVKPKALECGAPPLHPYAKVTVTMGDSGKIAVYGCEEGYANVGGKRLTSACQLDKSWPPVDISCNNLTTCYTLFDNRAHYHGTLAVSKTGLPCQKWSSQYPNRHWFGTSYSFKKTTGVGRETVKEASNFCRDPGIRVSEKKIWCYVIDPARKKRWEECNVPNCQVTV